MNKKVYLPFYNNLTSLCLLEKVEGDFCYNFIIFYSFQYDRYFSFFPTVIQIKKVAKKLDKNIIFLDFGNFSKVMDIKRVLNENSIILLPKVEFDFFKKVKEILISNNLEIKEIRVDPKDIMDIVRKYGIQFVLTRYPKNFDKNLRKIVFTKENINLIESLIENFEEFKHYNTFIIKNDLLGYKVKIFRQKTLFDGEYYYTIIEKSKVKLNR